MPDLTISVPVAAPAPVVWSALTDWDAQGEWMLATRVRTVGPQRRGIGDRLSAFTGLGPVGFTDTMVVSAWEEGEFVRVDHTGNVVRGWGVFSVEPITDDRSMVHWTEGLEIPGGAVGRVVWRLTRPISAWAVRYSLGRFARLVESANEEVESWHVMSRRSK